MIKMVNVTQLRNKIENKIFNGLGSDLLVSSVETSVNTRGDSTNTYVSIGPVKGVPYNVIKNRDSKEVFGDIQEGDLVCVFKYDQDLDIGYKVELNSVEYLVQEIEDFPLLNEVLLKSVLLRRVLP